MTRPLLAGLAISQLSLLVVSVYLHRYLAHRAFRLSLLAAVVLRALLWVSTGIDRRRWVALHRFHHLHADDPLDPHSPIHLGFWRVQLGDHRRARRLARDDGFVARRTQDLTSDRLDVLLFDRTLLGPALAVAMTVVAVGPGAASLIWLSHAAASKVLGNTIAAVGHRFGSHPYPDADGRDNWWLAAITAGEGFHNSHHRRPRSPSFKGRGLTLDPGWWLIATLVRLRLASLTRTIPITTSQARHNSFV